MICQDGINTIPLGICVEITFNTGHFANDMMHSLIINFEKNNHFLENILPLYGYYVLSTKLPIMETDHV
tara:strand:+ start:325 stop:531 length:207 start_codon:yes stop_codon:yes gene_type:complete